MIRGSELIWVLFGLALMLPVRPENMCRHSTRQCHRAQYLQRKLAAETARIWKNKTKLLLRSPPHSGGPKFFLDSSIWTNLYHVMSKKEFWTRLWACLLSKEDFGYDATCGAQPSEISRDQCTDQGP